MSELSEEEIIKIIKPMIKDINCLCEECPYPNETCECKNYSCKEKAIEGLLDLYKKEKEENEKLRVEFEKVYEDNLTLAHELCFELEQEKEKNKELEATLKQTQDSWFEDTQKIEQLKLNGKDLQEKLKIATAMLTKGIYPEQNEGDNDFDKQFISKDKIKEKIKEREYIIHNAKLKYGQDYDIYDDVIYARQEIELYKELLEMN